jgi:hypothetical protein
VTQALQVMVQRRVIGPTLQGDAGGWLAAPLFVRLLARYPILQRLPARLVGLGIRPEHIRSTVSARRLRCTRLP